VEKGETINQIAQKYHVTPYDIYKLNPDAQSGLKPNSVLLIGKQSVATTPVASAKNECSGSLAYCCCQKLYTESKNI
jgi:LysM repeat protein